MGNAMCVHTLTPHMNREQQQRRCPATIPVSGAGRAMETFIESAISAFWVAEEDEIQNQASANGTGWRAILKDDAATAIEHGGNFGP